jgi:HEAT repeats
VGKVLKIALFVTGVIVVTGIVFYIRRPREPIYEGRPLSVWIVGNDSDKASEAMWLAGTNAIPTLFRMLRAKDSALKLKLISLARKQRIVPINYVSALERNQRAASAFGMLGASGSQAVPGLIQVFEEGISTESKRLTAFALGSIGPPAKEATPCLLRGMADPDYAVRQSIVRALGQIKSEPALVVPVLIKSLTDPVESVRVDSVFALEGFGPDAKAAVPALTESLRDADAAVSSLAAHALKQIKGEDE